jgi:tRNA/rRNA methyltransferase
MPVHNRLDNIAVVLNKPRIPENIGSAARAMCNMGVRDLMLVEPRDCDLSRVLKTATHTAGDVVEQMRVYETLPEALAPFNFVVGTTARLGGQREGALSPAQTAERLIPISSTNRIALLFGPEDRGLTNAELRLCHWLATIPTAGFASLNLAQAVLVMCYEIFTAGRETPVVHASRLASRHELDGMYAQVTDILTRIHYVNPENPDYWMHKIRQFFTRLQLSAKEVSIIRGICRQFYWYTQKRYQDGLKDGRKQSDSPGHASE